ncbi:TPA: hypothetical protein ACMDOB_003203 [Vibrio metschnikovii]
MNIICKEFKLKTILMMNVNLPYFLVLNKFGFFFRFIVIASFLIISTNNYSKEYIIDRPTTETGFFYPLETVNVVTPMYSSVYVSSGDWNDRPTGYGFTLFSPPTYDARCFNMKSYLKTIDGYTGIRIEGTNDIILVIYDSTVEGVIPKQGDVYTSKGKWDSYGKYSQVSGFVSTCDWTGSPQTPTVLWDKSKQDAKAWINYGLYISKNASEGTYNIPRLTLFKGSNSATTVQAAVIPPGDKFILNPGQKCSISLPSKIDFGVVNINNSIKDKELTSVRSGLLSIACDLSSHATIKVTGITGESSKALKMNLDTLEKAPAEIRGFLGDRSVISDACTSDGASGQIDFSSLGSSYDAGIVKSGINTIGIHFHLCGTGERNPGNATAQATITIAWP